VNHTSHPESKRKVGQVVFEVTPRRPVGEVAQEEDAGRSEYGEQVEADIMSCAESALIGFFRDRIAHGALAY
jgi:hypothetical protein